MSLAAFLTAVVRVLEEAGVPYMLTGSLAAAYYALPRATQDVDLVVDASAGHLWAALDRAYIEEWVEDLGLRAEWETLLERVSLGGEGPVAR